MMEIGIFALLVGWVTSQAAIWYKLGRLEQVLKGCQENCRQARNFAQGGVMAKEAQAGPPPARESPIPSP